MNDIPAETGKFVTHVLNDQSEVVRYGTAGIPLSIQTESLSHYQGMRSIPHWHEDFEIIYIISGELIYHVNGEMLPLHTNDCVLVNAGQIHYSTSNNYAECTFTCILFHPKLFMGSRRLFEKCLKPTIDNPAFDYIYIPPRHALHSEIATMVFECITLQAEDTAGFELLVLSRLSMLLWELSLKNNDPLAPAGHCENISEIKTQRKMISFIRQSYMEHITLGDIAASGNVCRSKCCDLFRKYIMQTPIEYLRHYRLEASRSLLENTNLSITDVSGNCGFEQSSYYIRLFKEKYGCTPAKYRKMAIHK